MKKTRKKLKGKREKIHRTAREKRQLRRERLVSLAFFSPSLIGLMVFFVLPFFVVVYYAFVNNPVQQQFVGFDNFKALFQNFSFRLAAKNTAIFSVVSVPAAVIGALVLACIVNQKIPLKSQIRSFLLTPMMVPVASVVLIWQVVFSNNGALNEFLANFGVDKIDWMKSEYNRYVVILLFLWKNLGYNMILFLAALNNVPTDIQEMAMLEGAGSLRIFFQIKLRYIFPTVLFVTILSLINSLKIFREVYLLTGKYPYDGLYLLQHFMNNTFESMDYQKLSSAALVLAFAMVIIIGLLFLVDGKLGKDVEES